MQVTDLVEKNNQLLLQIFSGNMEVRTLTDISLSAITRTFNEAFKNYFIPLHLSEDDMQAKIRTEGIQLNYSAGAFIDEELVGFILHAFDVIDGVRTIYNAGTGVVAEHRGKKITRILYDFSVQLLNQFDIHDHLLEVIDQNIPALRVYEAVGFTTCRSLSSFKTTDQIPNRENYSVQLIAEIPEDKNFHSVSPSWQNSTASINRNVASHEIIGAFQDDQLVAYAAWAAAAGRIKQVGVHADHRQTGAGTALFHYMRQHSGNDSLLITNIDDDFAPAAAFLYHLGFKKIATVYEMKMHCS